MVPAMDSAARGRPQSHRTQSEGLFPVSLEVVLPESVGIAGHVLGNPVRQLSGTRRSVAVTFHTLAVRNLAGYRGILPDGTAIAFFGRPTTVDSPVIVVPDASSPSAIAACLSRGEGHWSSPRPQPSKDLPIEELERRSASVTASWLDKFTLQEERVKGTQTLPGLRRPQVGALHAVLAHWTVTHRPATIVMPTGTGKTETMLAVYVATRIPRLMVVVPNSELRDQIARKFLTLGILQSHGCLDHAASLPIVAALRHIPKTTAEVDEVFRRANVVVTTMQIAGQTPPELQARMAEHITHLFIDEAHHIPARTWTSFRNQFTDKHVLQFTATPFRTDGRRIDGKFIYTYPLRKAQEEGYFKQIRFEPVQGTDPDEVDEAIVGKVGAQLRQDLHAGFDHLAMARVNTIDRAMKVLECYRRALPDFNPILVHSALKSAQKRAALQAIQTKQSRIIVCVDMLGEGFDLPELKIAALHDRHKSIAITLQFTGRFTRTQHNLGEATVIANIAQDDIIDSLRALYAEDADWNYLLSIIGEARTRREVKRAEILDGFAETFERIPLRALAPRMSTVVYKVSGEHWKPDAIHDVLRAGSIFEGPIVNERARLAIFVTRDDENIRWGSIKELVNTEWNLFLVHWDETRNLLFINSSKTKDFYEPIAKAIAGQDAELIRGERMFRVLDGFKRLILLTLGLTETQRKPIRYAMFMGSDIVEQITEAARRNRIKNNLFGQGYTLAGKATMGCSAKGRIWSHDATSDFSEWIDWCHEIGRKLLDETILTDAFIRNLVRPRPVTARPDKPPIAIEWPDYFIQRLEDRVDITIGTTPIPFRDCGIELDDHASQGPLKFTVRSALSSAHFELEIDAAGARYRQTAGDPATVRIGSQSHPLADAFKQDPPPIYFADGDMLMDNELFVLPEEGERRAFDLAKIEVGNWTGINIRKESQGEAKDANSIQRRVIDRTIESTEGYEIVFDDDGPGEAADVVAMRLVGERLKVHLFHCKYSGADIPGSRIEDLYAVCGQAQKSIRWREYPRSFLRHLQKRESDRTKSGRPSRMEKGSVSMLNSIANRWRDLAFEFQVTIVQPGISKRAVSPQQLELLAATEAYLVETWNIPLSVLSSS